MVNELHWGIIGCGDVTEVKSGPAFNKIAHSSLHAVMRRNAVKAEDYASRHQVPVWYTNAQQLIDDPQVNAIYIATPPDSHEELAIRAMEANKPVYLEKPVTLNAAAAKRIQAYVNKTGARLSVAHYRREQPIFRKIKELLGKGAIGEVRYADMKYMAPLLTDADLQNDRIAWRVNPEVSGGGLFHDLAPHQLDLMCYFFGEVAAATGVAVNQAGRYIPPDMISGIIRFKSGFLYTGSWSFAAPVSVDSCTIYGSKGFLTFSVFGKPVIQLTIGEHSEQLSFEPLPHVQQPMIEAVVNYFRGVGPNPCDISAGLQAMELMEAFAAS